MYDFKGKAAIVTGGSRGIGKAIAVKLAENGAKVFFTYRQGAEAAGQTVEEIKALGAEVSAHQVDSGDFNAVKEFTREIKRQAGNIDYLVNNSGITIDKPFFLMGEQDWDQVINTNLKGTFNFCRNVIVDFCKKKSGAIVNVSSVAGVKGIGGQVNYCSSKAGIINFTRALAREAGRSGVRVNAVAPGYIETDMLKNLKQEALENILEQIPLRKLGKAGDVAEAVLFLLSEKSSYITGHTIIIDGGLIV